jgi:hypothetical protein
MRSDITTDASDTAGQAETSWVERLHGIGGIVAPTTVVTALLVWFGYVGTRARFQYFGVDLDLTDLSNQDLVLYGLEVVYVPAAGIALATLVAVASHAAVAWMLTEPGRRTAGLMVASAAAVVGALLLARATIGVLVPHVAREEVPGTTPLSLAAGPALIGYATWIALRALRHGAGESAGARFAEWSDGATGKRLRRVALAAVGGLVVAGLFWASNSFAAAFGASRGYDDATHLPGRPEVVIDTKEPLVALPPGVTQQRLNGSAFHYRYRGLRLLLESGGRLFLVPARWTTQGKALVVPYDADIRLQLVPAGP